MLWRFDSASETVFDIAASLTQIKQVKARVPGGKSGDDMLKRAPSADQLAAVRRLKAWTRKRFMLEDDIVVFVAEVACGLPGCPPLETIVTFWTTPDTRHEFKLFKRVVEVAEDDLPPRWMKNAIVNDGTGVACC